MKIQLKIILPFLLSAMTAPAAAQQGPTSVKCSEADPAVAHVKKVSSGASITVARRGTSVRVAPPSPLCSGDVIQPSKSSATVVVDGNRQTEIIIREQRLYHYDGYAFVVGDRERLRGRSGGIDQANNTIDGNPKNNVRAEVATTIAVGQDAVATAEIGSISSSLITGNTSINATTTGDKTSAAGKGACAGTKIGEIGKSPCKK